MRVLPTAPAVCRLSSYGRNRHSRSEGSLIGPLTQLAQSVPSEFFARTTLGIVAQVAAFLVDAARPGAATDTTVILMSTKLGEVQHSATHTGAKK